MEKLKKLLPEQSVRRYIVLLALLFAVAFPSGLYTTDPFLRGVAKTFVDLMKALVEEMAGGVFFLVLLLNNVFASLLLMYSGILFGIFPVVSVGLNGFLMGLVYRHVSESAGAVPAAFDMLPHALFEIPALLVVAAYGLWIGVGAIRRVRGKGDRTIQELTHLAVRRYFTLVFPLMIAAAAAETFQVLRAG